MSIRASTLLARSERALTQFILRRKHQPSDVHSTTVFCLNAPSNILQNAFDHLTNRGPSSHAGTETSLKSSKASNVSTTSSLLGSGRIIGCLSDPLSPEYPISLSLLTIPTSLNHIVWRSTIPGQEKAQVGRWYSQEQILRERGSFKGAFTPSPSFRSKYLLSLPLELEELVKPNNHK